MRLSFSPRLAAPFSALLLTAALVLPTVAVAEQVPAAVRDMLPTLQSWGSNPVLIAAVEAQNAEGKTLAQIQARDAEWRQTSEIDAGMQALLDNAAAQELRRLEKSEAFFFEIFLMDGQGANVAMTNKTSDYWQGDEAKFTESFAGGQGSVHVGDVEFDESAQAYLVQVSVPVLQDGQAIGAMTIGIDLDALEGQ